MIDDVLGIPDQLRDALWRVEGARLQPAEAAGVLVCGMGGSGIGADLAAAALGSRLRRPLITVRGYELPAWASSEWTVLCSSYSGSTEETLSCFAAAERLGARRIVASTGGPLVEAAREAGVPVIGLPGIFQPRAAVAYMLVVAAEIAALVGAAPSPRAEVEAAADFLAGETAGLRERAAAIAAELEGSVPIVHGAGLTVPVARRWKTQLNENAKLPAFFSELPEADHNEICGWAAERSREFAGLFLEDADQHPRERRRFELTAAAVRDAGAAAVRVETRGDSRLARLAWATMLGDLVSLELADRTGVDPVAIEPIERLKEAMGEP